MNSGYFKDKSVLITGCCGTVGHELVDLLLTEYGVKRLVGVDNNETELFFLEQVFQKHGEASFYLGDVRDQAKLVNLMQGMDIVFHAAAYKHVILCERSPFEAVQTNIIGVKNVLTAAAEAEVGKVVFTSSDKAVNPTNVMGTSKLMGERLVTAANQTLSKSGTVCVSTRFGNVLGSRGSVIPIFRKQIQQGGPVTLTDPEMTRFIMSIRQAAKLVVQSVQIARGGEVLITKMPTIRIQDLAEVMIEELAPKYGHAPADIGINVIGKKPGEKMYEELMSDEEVGRTMELEKYFSVLPAFRGYYDGIDYHYDGILSEKVTNPYNSQVEMPLTKEELRSFLIDHDLL